MITGDQIRDARVAAGWTQEQLANRLGVTLRTVGNWERSTPPKVAQARLRSVLADHLDTAGEPPLRSVSDAELLAEIARRFARPYQKGVGSDVDSAANDRAGESPADAAPDVEWSDYVRSVIGDDRQIDAAGKTGLDQTTISRWLNGAQAGLPENVARFARGYGRDVLEAYLVAGFITPGDVERPTGTPSQRGSHGVEGLPPGSGVVSSRPAHGRSRSRDQGGAGTRGSSTA